MPSRTTCAALLVVLPLLLVTPLGAAEAGEGQFLGGLSLGTPGGLNADVVLSPMPAENMQLGFRASLCLVTALANGQTLGDDVLTALQLGMPVFLLHGRRYFVAIEPLAGLGYFRPVDYERGRWFYGGVAADFFVYGLFVQVGVAAGLRDHYAGVELGHHNLSLLASIGFLWEPPAGGGGG
jgi:hypothetical protein